jgi:hypothetical protein
MLPSGELIHLSTFTTNSQTARDLLRNSQFQRLFETVKFHAAYSRMSAVNDVMTLRSRQLHGRRAMVFIFVDFDVSGDLHSANIDTNAHSHSTVVRRSSFLNSPSACQRRKNTDTVLALRTIDGLYCKRFHCCQNTVNTNCVIITLNPPTL